MQNNISESEKHEIKKIKRTTYTVFGVFLAAMVASIVWFCSYQYWHSFSSEKWLEYPEKRANMTADLLERYEIIGMTEDEVVALLGQNNNDYGYFIKDNRFVYYLGNERTIIDSEWLLIEFEDNIVTEYSMAMD